MKSAPKKASVNARPRKKRAYHHGELRRGLLDAALDVAMREGPHNITLSHAARLLGVSSGAPFHHFKTKEDLIRALVEEAAAHITALREAELSKLSGKERSVERTFLSKGIAHVKFALLFPGHFRVMSVPEYKALARSPEMEDALLSNERAMRILLSEASSEARELSARLLAAQSMIHGLAVMFVGGQLPRDGVSESDVERLVTEVARALGPAR